VISRVALSLTICTGGAVPPLRQERHFSDASSFARRRMPSSAVG
jgi:hypothetical protein